MWQHLYITGRRLDSLSPARSFPVSMTTSRSTGEAALPLHLHCKYYSLAYWQSHLHITRSTANRLQLSDAIVMASGISNDGDTALVWTKPVQRHRLTVFNHDAKTLALSKPGVFFATDAYMSAQKEGAYNRYRLYLIHSYIGITPKYCNITFTYFHAQEKTRPSHGWLSPPAQFASEWTTSYSKNSTTLSTILW